MSCPKRQHFLQAAKTYCMLARALCIVNPGMGKEYLKSAKEQIWHYYNYQDLDKTDTFGFCMDEFDDAA